MADIICAECKASVSDESGVCPECGYPFDSALAVQDDVVVEEAGSVEPVSVDVVEENVCLQPETPEIQPLVTVLLSLGVVGEEIKALQGSVADIRQNVQQGAAALNDNVQKMLAEMTVKLDAVAAAQNAMQAAQQAEAGKKSKKGLLAAFYKTLNSPNSMFEYMFYISVVQVLFVIVNLFLAAYLVTLVR